LLAFAIVTLFRKERGILGEQLGVSPFGRGFSLLDGPVESEGLREGERIIRSLA
jgi:hypothetical protein